MCTVRLTITPEIAQEFLTHNTANRNPRPSQIKAYAKAMAEGRWQLNPEGISFYENGVLRDGQNRLYAIIAAGIPIDMMVTYNVPNNSTICDMQTRRTLSDSVVMLGVPESVMSPRIASVTNLLFDLTHGNGGRTTTNPAFARDFLLDEAENIEEFTNVIGKDNKAKTRISSIMAALYIAFRQGVSKETIRRFCDVVNTGFYNGAQETAAIVIRNKVLQSGATSGRGQQRYLCKATLRAIYDFDHGVPRKIMYKDMPDAPYFKAFKEQVMSRYI